MRSIAENIYVAEQPLCMLGIEYGARMTVIRLSNHDLVVISPIALNESLKQKINSIGTVKYLVAPSSFHHLFIKPWTEKYTWANLLMVPQIAKKRKDLQATSVLNQSFNAPWTEELLPLFIPGGKLYSEMVFLHRSSRTLILTDLCFNLQEANSLFARCALSIYGIYKKFGPSKAVGMFMGKKVALKEAIDRIAAWDFQRVVMAHGEILENTTPKDFKSSFDQMLKGV